MTRRVKVACATITPSDKPSVKLSSPLAKRKEKFGFPGLAPTQSACQVEFRWIFLRHSFPTTDSQPEAFMSYADETRRLLEARELLAKQRNLKTVVQFYINRGVPPEEAQTLVDSIYRENLKENRKFSFNWLVGGAVGLVIAIALLVFGGWNILTIVAVPLCVLALIIGVGRFLVASGYEMVDDD